MTIQIYTDGSCWPTNGGPGGYAAILVEKGVERIVQGNHPSTTNNRMEIEAVMYALLSLDRAQHLEIHSDSKYVVQSIGHWIDGKPSFMDTGWIHTWSQNDWVGSTGPVKNLDLWQRVMLECQFHKSVKMYWVKGHVGHDYNERCDKLAKKQRKMIRVDAKSGRVPPSNLNLGATKNDESISKPDGPPN